MSNPTSSFGWQMPTSVDLVTDLPADFEVFGQAVDSSMADLLGGTTGQILAKNSATNMDFVWITNDVGDITAVTAGTGITGGGTSGAVTITNDMATTITAAGDIVVGTGSGTYDNLPIGTTAQVLTADTTVSPYKVKWATPASGGGMTLLSTTNTTTGAAYTVSSISADYINLLLMWNGACTAGSVLTLSFAGGNSSGGGVKEDGVLTTWTATNAKLMPDTQGAGNIVSCLITNYKETAEKTLQIAFGGVNTGWRGGAAGGFSSYTSAISTLTITLSAGSFSSGSLRIFGVK